MSQILFAESLDAVPSTDAEGATPEMIQDMDQWLGAYAELAKERFPKADAKYPGTGAAGGMGFAFLTFTDAVLESGDQHRAG